MGEGLGAATGAFANAAPAQSALAHTNAPAPVFARRCHPAAIPDQSARIANRFLQHCPLQCTISVRVSTGAREAFNLGVMMVHPGHGWSPSHGRAFAQFPPRFQQNIAYRLWFGAKTCSWHFGIGRWHVIQCASAVKTDCGKCHAEGAPLIEDAVAHDEQKIDTNLPHGGLLDLIASFGRRHRRRTG